MELSANGLPTDVPADVKETVEQNAINAAQNEEYIPLAEITNEQYQAMRSVDLDAILADMPASEGYNPATDDDSAASKASFDKPTTINGFVVSDDESEEFTGV